jgi:hypothetical protein
MACVMPTFEATSRFWSEFDSLSADQQEAFARARQQFIRALKRWEVGGCEGRAEFPAALRVKPVKGRRGIWELTWAGDGRCTWEFGTSLREEPSCHILWRRIGSHEIFRDP